MCPAGNSLTAELRIFQMVSDCRPTHCQTLSFFPFPREIWTKGPSYFVVEKLTRVSGGRVVRVRWWLSFLFGKKYLSGRAAEVSHVAAGGIPELM